MWLWHLVRLAHLHDRTGRLESHPCRTLYPLELHDRTGRLESKKSVNATPASLHDRTGRLEILLYNYADDLKFLCQSLENFILNHYEYGEFILTFLG